MKIISRKYVLLTFSLLSWFKYAYPMQGPFYQQTYFNARKLATPPPTTAPHQYSLYQQKLCQPTCDFRNAESGSLTLQLTKQAQDVKTIHSLIHDIVSLQKSPFSLRSQSLIERPCRNAVMYTPASSSAFASKTVEIAYCSDTTYYIQKTLSRADLNEALKQINNFSRKYDISHDSISSCVTALTYSEQDQIKATLKDYNISAEQAIKLLDYTKQYESARAQISQEKIAMIRSFSLKKFQEYISKCSSHELQIQRYNYSCEIKRLISNFNKTDKQLKICYENKAQIKSKLFSRGLMQSGLERLGVWSGDYKADYYAQIAKVDDSISELKYNQEENKAQRDVILEKIKIIEKAEKTVVDTYKQQLRDKSLDELQLMRQDTFNDIQAVGKSTDFSVPRVIVDALKEEYNCITEIFTEKRIAKQVYLLHERYDKDIHTRTELNTTEDLEFIIKERYEALQKTLYDNFATSIFNFQLNEEGRISLEKRGADVSQFEHIKGNAFVGQLCKEQCGIINHVGQLRDVLRQSPHYIKAPRLSDLLQTPKEELANAIQSSEQFVDCCLELTTDATILANQATHLGQLEQAVELNDYSQALLESFENLMTTCECADQFLTGLLFDGPKNVITGIYRLGSSINHMLNEITHHPTTAIPYYVKKAAGIAKTLAKLTTNVAYHSARMQTANDLLEYGDYDHAMEIFEEEAQYLEPYVTALQEYFQDKTWPELSRMGGAFASECFLSKNTKLLVGKTYRLARIGGIRTKQLLTQSLKRLNNPNLLMRTPEGILFKAAKSSLKKTSKITKNARDAIGKIKPQFITEKDCHLSKLKELSAKIALQIKHPFDCVVKNINLEHVLGIDIKGRILGSSVVNEALTGFHKITKKAIVDKYGKKGIHLIKKLQTLKFENWCGKGKTLTLEVTKYFPETGIFQAIPRLGTTKMLGKTKTYFPLQWGYEKTVKSIWEAYQNPIRPLELTKKGRLAFVGETVEKIQIKIVIDKVDEVIHAAYPYIPKK